MSELYSEIKKNVLQWAIIGILTFISGGVVSIYRKVDRIELVQDQDRKEIDKHGDILDSRSAFMQNTELDLQQLKQRVRLHERVCVDLRQLN